MSERGRATGREEEQPPRKSSRSRERGVLFEDDEEHTGSEISEIKVMFNSTYPRLLKSPDPVKVFEGADAMVQELINEKFFKQRQKFIREKAEYEERVQKEKEVFAEKEREFQHLDAVFQKLAVSQQQTSATASAVSTASTASADATVTSSSGFSLNIFGSK